MRTNGRLQTSLNKLQFHKSKQFLDHVSKFPYFLHHEDKNFTTAKDKFCLTIKLSSCNLNTNAYVHACSTAFLELGIPVVLSRDMSDGSLCKHESKYFRSLSQMSLSLTAGKAEIKTVQSETSRTSRKKYHTVCTDKCTVWKILCSINKGWSWVSMFYSYILSSDVLVLDEKRIFLETALVLNQVTRNYENKYIFILVIICNLQLLLQNPLHITYIYIYTVYIQCIVGWNKNNLQDKRHIHKIKLLFC
jgi:hypothetical protein